jgi:PucR family transcriptional regulator, purine catabolism regulatory protein
LVFAQEAAAAARRSREQVGRFEELILQAVLVDDVVRSRISILCAPALAPLVDGQPRDRELITSLRSFLRHNGSWETASRAVGVHRHTLRSHISRVEELTGLSLDVADNRVVLALALMTTSD